MSKSLILEHTMIQRKTALQLIDMHKLIKFTFWCIAVLFQVEEMYRIQYVKRTPQHRAS